MKRHKMKCIQTLAAFLFLLFLLPGQIHAATTVTTAATYYAKSFNSKSTVTIPKAESYEDSGKYTWIKYKASKTGYVKLSMSKYQQPVSASDTTSGTTEALSAEGLSTESTSGRVQLYDKNKSSQLSASVYYNTAYANSCYSNLYFGVTKNTTYYFKVSATDGVKLKLTMKSNQDKSGNKLNNAVKLKKNKAKSGIITPAQKVGDWYKIVLTKKQVLNLYYSAKTSGALSIRIYYGYKFMGNVTMTRSMTKEQHIYAKTDYGSSKKAKVPAGTYYIRISSYDAKSSGYYSIKWK